MIPPLFIGLISGTSMDAIDCALVDLAHEQPKVLDFICGEIPASLKASITELIRNQAIDLRQIGAADVALGEAFAKTALAMLARHDLPKEKIAAIGSHGQTIWHQPSPDHLSSRRFTFQIGDPNTIAQMTGITTVADFRRRDMAAGGQGAPLVPALHRAMFNSVSTPRVVLNLGGIANITVLPIAPARPFGYDTGPANILMDSWIQQNRPCSYDEDGAWALTGAMNPTLLRDLLADPYFQQSHPKSTGRELFNLTWLQNKLASFSPALAAEDVQATLLELTAESVSQAIRSHLAMGEVLVCGGGARNGALMRKLQEKLSTFTVASTSEHGVHADCVEAVAFAWFAQQTLQGTPVDFSPFTGAACPVIAGGIYRSL